MRTFFKFAVIMLHIINCIIIAVFSTSRFIWYREWRVSEELLLWISVVVTFAVHYTLMYVGYKKDALSIRMINALKIIEIVLFGPQLFLLCLTFITKIIDIPFGIYPNVGQYWPIAITDIAILIIRKVWCNYFLDKLG